MQQPRTSAQSGAHGSNSTTFEQQFMRLQEVVQKLSDGNLALSDALAAFEEGMLLADSCGKMLEEAELRVKQISERSMLIGSASLAELDQVMHSVNSDAGELVSIEVETYESTFVFDSLIEEAGKRQGANGQARGTAKSSQPLELDPLFSEDD